MSLHGSQAQEGTTKDRAIIDYLVAASPGKVVDSDGGTVNAEAAGRTTARLTMTWQDNRWFVARMQQVVL